MRLGICVFAVLLSASSQSRPPLVLDRTIPLPGVEGRIDHLAADVPGKHLFVAALGNHTIEVIDLAAGKVINHIKGLGEPQGLAYAPDLKKLYAADGADGSVRIYDVPSMRPRAALKLDGDADNVRYDSRRRQIWVGYGGGALALIDANTDTVQSEMKVTGHPESFQLEEDGPRIFVNVPDTRNIVVFDRGKRLVVGRWPVAPASENFPMALDDVQDRLYVGCRKPPRLLVYNTVSGKQVDSVAIHGDTDDVFYDGERYRTYVICGEGFVDVPGTGTVPTAPGARTGLYVPALKRLYVAVPRRGPQRAEIRVYR